MVDNFIQSVQDATKDAPKSINWYRDKIREFGKPGALDLIRDGRRLGKPSMTLSIRKLYHTMTLSRWSFHWKDTVMDFWD